jgi:hypothetical protein
MRGTPSTHRCPEAGCRWSARQEEGGKRQLRRWQGHAEIHIATQSHRRASKERQAGGAQRRCLVYPSRCHAHAWHVATRKGGARVSGRSACALMPASLPIPYPAPRPHGSTDHDAGPPPLRLPPSDTRIAAHTHQPCISIARRHSAGNKRSLARSPPRPGAATNTSSTPLILSLPQPCRSAPRRHRAKLGASPIQMPMSPTAKSQGRGQPALHAPRLPRWSYRRCARPRHPSAQAVGAGRWW